MTVYTLTTLDTPLGNSGTSANDINKAGQIVGSYIRTTVSPISLFNYGFLYNPQDGTYTTIDDPLAGPRGGIGGGTFAQGISDGQVVGFYTGLDNPTNPTAGTYGFLYSGGIYTTLKVLGATQTRAYGVNNAGQIAGYYSVGSVNVGFLRDPSSGIYTNVNDPVAGPGGTFAYGINNFGQIVGTYNDASGSGFHGFLYSRGTYTTIDYPSATDTVLTGINDLGQIVGDQGYLGGLAELLGDLVTGRASTDYEHVLTTYGLSSFAAVYGCTTVELQTKRGGVPSGEL